MGKVRKLIRVVVVAIGVRNGEGGAAVAVTFHAPPSTNVLIICRMGFLFARQSASSTGPAARPPNMLAHNGFFAGYAAVE